MLGMAGAAYGAAVAGAVTEGVRGLLLRLGRDAAESLGARGIMGKGLIVGGRIGTLRTKGGFAVEQGRNFLHRQSLEKKRWMQAQWVRT